MLKLSELTQDSYSADHVVARAAGEAFTWGRFVADVCRVRAQVAQVCGACWALYEPDTYRFAVNFVALLAAGKTVCLPGENHQAMVAALQAEGAVFIGEFAGVDTLQWPHAPGGSGDCEPLRLSGSVVVYTSGSTGAPKGIPKSLAQIDAELVALEASWGREMGASVIAGTVSQQHVYGLLFLVCWPLCAGRCFWHRPFVDPAIMARELSAFPAAAWVMSPAHLHRLADDIPWALARGTTTAVFSSGGPLASQGAAALFKGLGRYPVEVLGSSETGGIAWRQQSRPDALWTPLPGVDVKTDSTGALCVKSPWLEDEQWYVSADQATLDGDSGFRLGARLDRIVKVEGKRVSLPEIEQALERHDWVAQCAVVVLARRRQVLGAALVLTPGGDAALTEVGRHRFTRALRHYLADHLAGAALPRVWRTTASLPRNTQGKLMLREVEALFAPARMPRVTRREETGSGCTLWLTVAPDNPYFKGHFDAAPVVPGVVQLLWAQQYAEQLLDLRAAFVGLNKIKFRDIISPQQDLMLTLDYRASDGVLTFQYASQAGIHSQGTMLFEAIV